MSLREVNFARDVVHGIAYLLGVDPTNDLLRDHARAWTASINDHVRRAWGMWPWPEMQVTEERAFRQVWHASVTYLGGNGDESEVYYIPDETYYRATGDPDLGSLPSDLDRWEAIPTAEMDYHIAYQQYGKEAIDRFIAIHDTNPRLNHASLTFDFTQSSYGVDFFPATGRTVWVTYIPRPPEFTTETYSASTTYSRGDLVLDLDTGNCYRALLANTNQPFALTTYWLRQKMPYVLSRYVRYAAAAEQADDIQQKSDLRGEAEDALTSEMDNLVAQGQISYYKKPSAHRWPLGVTNAYRSAYWSSVTA